MREAVDTNDIRAKNSVIDVLVSRGNKALFATELLAGLRRFNLSRAQMDQALAELVDDGSVLVRDNFCADPHLAEVDLRVVALLDGTLGAQAHAAALHEIDLSWNKWLGEYLANHRCG
jgi:hypothetical protein